MGRLFDSNVTISGSRGNNPRVSLTVSCCRMDGSLDEPFADTGSNSVRRRYSFVVKSRDLGGVVPQTGDLVTVEDGKRFSVITVQPFYDREFILDCRSC